MLNRSAIRTRSANDFAAIFRMTLPRCTFTVISVTPISAATCLFNKPPVTQAMTSCSRGVKVENFLFRSETALSFSSFTRDLDGVQEILIAKWFGQKLDSSSLHCLHGHGYIAMASDENTGTLIRG